MQIIPIARIDTTDICKILRVPVWTALLVSSHDFTECTKSSGSVGFRGYPWVSVGIRGYPWVSVGHPFPWVSVGIFRGYPYVHCPLIMGLINGGRGSE